MGDAEEGINRYELKNGIMEAETLPNSLIPCRRYGKIYYRSRPLRYRDACTAVRQLQRGRMPAAVAFYRNLKDSFISRIWRVAAQEAGCSGYNLFVRHNINAFDREGVIADYSKITLSYGTLPLPEQLRVEKTGANQITVRWDNTLPVSYSRQEDRLFAAAIYGSNPFEVCFPDTEGICRPDLSATLILTNLPEDEIHLYLFFGSPRPENYSVQRYFFLD